MKLAELKENYQCIPILALTATANKKYRKDIEANLKMKDEFVVFQSTFNRPNIVYELE